MGAFLGPLAGPLVGAGLGMLSGAMNDARQVEQQERLMGIQLKGQKEMGEYNRKQAMRMWEDTNFRAQKEQLKKAGLNPGLLYGGGGGGGATTSVAPGSVGGASAAGNSGEAMAGLGMGMQLELLRAQKENIEADTKNKEAGAYQSTAQGDLINGPGIQKVREEISNIAQERKNLIAEEAFTKVKTDVEGIRRYVSNETKADEIKQIKAYAVGEALRNTLTEVKSAEAKQAIEKMIQDIRQGWRKIEIEKFRAEVEANFQGLDKVGGNLMQMIFKKIDEATGGKEPDQLPLKVGGK